ncbi:MAG: hypothetical protein HQ541_08325 [Mariniphaga sp.]|nr:hypothetical protein [Mariniphaga sp.]
MKANDFLIEKLKQLAEKIEEIQIRYEFRNSTQSHLVEIIPLRIFEENEAYMQEEAKLEAEFEQLYPTEEIIFISEGSLTEIITAELELGYDKIRFKNETSDIEFVIEGYNNIVETRNNHDYSLAA